MKSGVSVLHMAELDPNHMLNTNSADTDHTEKTTPIIGYQHFVQSRQRWTRNHKPYNPQSDAQMFKSHTTLQRTIT
jgi:hypothetical protein